MYLVLHNAYLTSLRGMFVSSKCFSRLIQCMHSRVVMIHVVGYWFFSKIVGRCPIAVHTTCESYNVFHKFTSMAKMMNMTKNVSCRDSFVFSIVRQIQYDIA